MDVTFAVTVAALVVSALLVRHRASDDPASLIALCAGWFVLLGWIIYLQVR